MPANTYISVVIPLYNESESLRELHARLTATLDPLQQPYELLFVDDGSVDASAQILEALSEEDSRVGIIQFRRNFGKAAALDAGFCRARGSYVVTMDADLQDEPTELPRFIEVLESGYDVVSGWKRVRNDPLSKTLPSKLFNAVVSRVSGLRLHDFNCGFKAYRQEALSQLALYGEMHRYVPALLHWQGFKIAEIPVQHHSRRFGHSKYGVERLLKGFFDLLTVLLNTRYRSRPLHLFGLGGAVLGLLGLLVLTYLSALWCMGEAIGHRPLLILGTLLVLVGVQLVSTGLLGELINRNQSTERGHYVVRRFLAPNSRVAEPSSSHGSQNSKAGGGDVLRTKKHDGSEAGHHERG